MESLEVTAKTVDEAIELALAQLSLTRDQVQISVLSQGSRGILGIGGEDARILVSPIVVEEPVEEEETAPTRTIRPEEITAAAQDILANLLSKMGLNTTIEVIEPDVEEGNEPAAAYLNVKGAELGVLIGRKGETLSSLQFMTNLILSRQMKKWCRVVIDVEGYRKRRQETLTGLAMRMAERACETKQPVPLEAMPPYERRIVHIALQNHPGVTTESFGEGENRKVVILPKRKR